MVPEASTRIANLELGFTYEPEIPETRLLHSLWGAHSQKLEAVAQNLTGGIV